MTESRISSAKSKTKLLVCDCEGSMQIDVERLREALGDDRDLPLHTQLCRRQISAFEAAMKDGAPLCVACTQEAPLFREVAEDHEFDDVSFVNIRERAGWFAGGGGATAKMAALITEAGHVPQPAGLITIRSEGQCLVYGAGQQTLDVAQQLSGRLSVTVILTDATDVVPPTTVEVPIHIGKIRSVSGALGAFALTVDRFAPAVPSSRDALSFEVPRDGFSTNCDLILDLSTDAPQFSDAVPRDGYFKVDPDYPAGVAKAMFEISDYVGEFEKPLYVDYNGDICAHSRSGKVGCRNCLDNCPSGAIAPNGDTVNITATICAGCGTCSAVCPTGAVSYAYPGRQDVLARIQTLASTYQAAGGQRPVLLIHDETHGAGAIAMMARYGRGLPENVIPLGLYSVFQVGHELFASAFASGFEQVVVAAPPDKPHDLPALEGQVGLMRVFLSKLGYGADRIAIVVESDPDNLEQFLYGLPETQPITPRAFAAVGGKREIARMALSALNAVAPEPSDMIELPADAPYGRLAIDVENCTVCLACVGACPVGALSDDEERPRLSFNESACVQCGLCVATCPEKVIALEPRYNFAADVLEPVVIKEEEPFACISCGKPFGTKSTVERIISKLEGRHAMFQNSAQIDIIKMCDDCRVIAVTDGGGDPFTLGERPKVRTTEDYLMGAVGNDDDEKA